MQKEYIPAVTQAVFYKKKAGSSLYLTKTTKFSWTPDWSNKGRQNSCTAHFMIFVSLYSFNAIVCCIFDDDLLRSSINEYNVVILPTDGLL